jgi:Zn-dependent membrane protease YugP
MVQIGANLAWPIFVMGLIMAFEPLQTAGIVLFSLAVLFALITLPVEFDASRRAVAMLTQSGIISWGQETEAVKAVLNAAAMTYVASAVSALLQLVRLLVLRNRNRD